MTLTSRNTAGTRAIPDVLRDPRQWWWGVQGGNPQVAAQDLDELRQGLPLHSVAHLRHEKAFFQGVFVMHLSAPEEQRLKWRRWRPFRTYAQPLWVPAPTEVLDVREPSSWREHRLGDVRIVDFLADGRPWEMAVVTIDTEVVITALTEAGS